MVKSGMDILLFYLRGLRAGNTPPACDNHVIVEIEMDISRSYSYLRMQEQVVLVMVLFLYGTS